MRYRALCAGLLASVAAGAGAAVAADYAVRPAPPPPPPVVAPAYISDWAGFYVGIHGGGGWGHKDFEPGVFATDLVSLAPPSLSPHGGVFGFQFGHNWQWGPIVGGVEIDYSGADLTEGNTFVIPPFVDIFTADTKIDALASARFRLGYLIFPNWLIYGTAGPGWGHQELTTTDTVPGSFTSVRSFANDFGWVAGVGVEWKFADHWLLRGEWLHYDFFRVDHDSVFSDHPLNAKTEVDVARAALSYKF
jgi:outer membrane immunogenic protein